MSEDLERAARDAVEAADNTQMVQQIAAILAAQQLTNQQPPAPAPPPARRPVGMYVAAGIGGAVAISFLAMAAALLAVAVAVGAVCATVCLLVLRSVWQDMQRKR